MNEFRLIFSTLVFLGFFWSGVYFYHDDYRAWGSETWLGEYFVGEEHLPLAGEGGLLTQKELRYCLHEKERLKFIGDHVDFTLALRYNAEAESFNSRCQVYKFDPREKFAIEKKLEDQDGIFAHQALEQIKNWRFEEASTDDFNATYYAIATGIFLFDLTEIPHAKVVQTRLWELGFFEGETNGNWEAKSKAALIDFKDANGFGESPTWDTATQQLLFGPDPVNSKSWGNKVLDDLARVSDFF